MKTEDMETALDAFIAPKQLPKLWPEPLGAEAFVGFAGDLIRTLEPHTESDIAAVLVQFLVAFGNAVGLDAFFPVERSRHPARLFAVVVGDSSKARKGTGWENVRALFAAADKLWAGRIASGLSSGEGLIWNVRDPVMKVEKDGSESVADSGEGDKRLLVVESEFASVLKVGNRESNTLSAVLRDAWDKSDLRTMTKNSPAKATGAHVSIIGHITLPELKKTLAATDCLNGFANRFVWVSARRSKLLPEGGNLPEDEFDRLAKVLSLRLDDARKIRQLTRSPEARDLWRQIYPRLTDDKSGMFGAVTSRAEAQVLRMSIIYALLDGAATISTLHLRAALEVWRYCEDSARFIFGDKLDNSNAEAIRAALVQAGKTGMTRKEFSALFSNHLSRPQMDEALAELNRHGLAHAVEEVTGGRPAARWFSGANKAT